MTLNGNDINLPTSVVIPLRDKFRARKLLRRQPLLFHAMLKQGKTWFTVDHTTITAKAECNNLCFLSLFFKTVARCLNTKCDFKHGFFTCDLLVDIIQVSVCVN